MIDQSEPQVWWDVCVGCGQRHVNPRNPPAYDVFGEGNGPYCIPCFATTPTGQGLVN